MSSYNEVRRALGAAMLSFQPDLNVYYYVPRTLIPPCAIIKPQPQQTINYLQAQSSLSARWLFHIMMVIGLVEEEAAQDLAGDLIAPGSPLLRALNRRLDTGYAQVTDAAISEAMFGEPPRQGLYTFARLSVLVNA